MGARGVRLDETTPNRSTPKLNHEELDGEHAVVQQVPNEGLAWLCAFLRIRKEIENKEDGSTVVSSISFPTVDGAQKNRKMQRGIAWMRRQLGPVRAAASTVSGSLPVKTPSGLPHTTNGEHTRSCER